MPETHAINDETLRRSGLEWIHKAFREYVDGGQAIVPTFAGIGLEHLAKAYLWTLDPALLVELRGDFDSLLHLVGQGQHASRPYGRTIGAAEAVSRVRKVLAPFRALPNDPIDAIIQQRNGTLHAGAPSEEDNATSLGAVIRACNVLLDAMNVDSDGRWGDWTELAESLIQKHAHAVEARVASKIAAARARYTSFLAVFPDKAVREMAVKTREHALVFQFGDRQLEHPCPACENTAWLGGTEEIRWETEWDVEGSTGPAYVVGEYPVVTFYPHVLQCGVCQLELEDEELQQADVETSWDLEISADEYRELQEDRYDY